MTQITRRRFNHTTRSSHLSKDKIVALISFLLLVVCACTTVISYLFLPDIDDVDIRNDPLFSEDQNPPRDLGILKMIRQRRREAKTQKKDRKVIIEEERRPQDNSQDPLDDDTDTVSKYDAFRKEYDEVLPFETKEDTQRLYDFVEELRKPKHELKSGLQSDLPYDINNCPEEPPKGYPIEWPLLDVLNNWKPNNISASFRPGIYQGLCRFDFGTEMHKAEKYRSAELPFLLRDDPQILKVVERWNQPDYLSEILGKDVKYHTEYSDTNSLMFYRSKQDTPIGWHAPMSSVQMTYDEWELKASQSEEDMGPDKPHYYFRVNAKGGNDHFMFKELPFFLPEENFYIVDTQATRGINCRFGMLGNTAAAHFDGSRNFVMLFGGERRYILSHPRNCPNLALYPRNHPSGRHSATDWSNPDLEMYPEFFQGAANEVVLQAGDVLYLPTQWFHYIVSLDLNWQCNARSGMTNDYQRHIRKCGF